MHTVYAAMKDTFLDLDLDHCVVENQARSQKFAMGGCSGTHGRRTTEKKKNSFEFETLFLLKFR